jgi:hypothetical protein
VLPSLVETLHGWQNFYYVIGAASATILGSMFVVASIGSGLLTEERAVGSRLFVNPIVVHLAIVLLGCALTMVPSLDWMWFEILFALIALPSFVYSAWIAWHVGQRRNLEVMDRFWYAGFPLVAYAVMMASVAMSALQVHGSLEVLAVAFALLLISGIRNAWDLIIFFIGQAKGGPS